MAKKKEKWKWVPGYEGFYKVSTRGKIKSYYIKGTHNQLTRKKGKFLKPPLNKGKYPCTILARNKKPTNFFVHTLVLLAFVGPCPEGKQCAHYDGNPQNNELSNLRWATRKENAADTRRHGRFGRGGARGEQNSAAKLTREQVIKIRREYARGGIFYRELAKKYNVATIQIWRVVNRRTWAWVV